MKKQLFYFFALLLATTFSWQANAQFSEDFEGGVPGAFTEAFVSASVSWGSCGGTLGGQTCPVGGTTSASFYSGNYSSDATSLTTGTLDLSAGGYSLEYTHGQLDWGGDQNTLLVELSTDGGTTWTTVVDHTTSINPAITTLNDLDAVATLTATCQIRFTATSGYGYSTILDDVSVAPTPSCPDPTALAATAVTGTTASVSWTAGGAETVWNVEYGATGFTTGTGTTITGATNPQAISFLTAGTTYDYYVTADCAGSTPAGTGTSAQVGPFTWTQPVSGATCVVALPIASLPFSDIGMTTAGFGDDYSTNDCGSSYMGGDDIVYAYTPAAAETVDVGLSNLTDNWTGIFITDVCPDIGGGFCASSNSGSGTGDIAINGVALTGGTTYYIIVSTWPTPQTTGGDVSLSLTPACVAPTGLGESGITTASADLAWTENGLATTWDIEYGVSPHTFTGTPTVTSVTNPYTLGSLATSTTYDYRVVGNGCTTWSATSTFTTNALPPANDECASATALTVNADLSCTAFTSGTLLSATASADPEGCSGTFDNDVWYSFVATATSHVVACNNIVGSSTDMVFQLLDGCAGTELQCHDTPDSGFTATGLTIGNTYLVRVDTWNGTAATTTFDMCIGTLPPPPANDDCGGATALTMGAIGVCTPTSSDNTSATDSGIAHGCAFYSGGDVWFSFVAPASGNVEIETGTNGGFTDGGMALYDGACGVFTLVDQIDCDDDTYGAMPGGSYTGLTPAATYYFAVWEYGNNATGTFDVCVYEPPNPPANDDACNAIAITVDAAEITGDNTQGTVETSEPSAACFSGGAQSTVWYTFVAPAGGICSVTTDFAGYTNGDTEVAVYDSFTCSDMTTIGAEIGCDQDGGTAENFNSVVGLSGLTPAATYYVQVSGYFASEGTFAIAVITPPACATPTALGETNITSVQADLDWTENGLATTWEVEYGATGFTQGTGTTVAAGTNPFTLTGLTASTAYDYYVTGTACAMWSTAGSFTTLDPPPANDLCAGAIAVSCGNTYTGVTDDATTTDAPVGTCGTDAGSSGIWYTMNVASDTEVTLDFCSSTYDTRVMVFSGSCASMTCIGGNDDGGPCGGSPDFHSNFTFNAFTGIDYYIYVNGFAGSTGTAEMSVTCASLCLPIPTNDDCGSAAAITIAPNGTCTPTSGTNECAVPATVVNNCESFNPIQDVWYTFTTGASETEIQVTLTDGTGTDWNYALYTTACPLIDDEDVDCTFGTTSGVANTQTVTASTTYWMQVWNNGGVDEGTFDLCLETPPPPPANDLACSATALTMNAAATAGSTVSATVQVGESVPSCGATPNNSVWYSFTSPADGQCNVTTSFAGSGDTHIAVYSGTDCATFTDFVEVDCDDDGGDGTTSELQFSIAGANALAGSTVYYVLVDHYFGTQDFSIQVNDCLAVGDITMDYVTTSSIGISWDAVDNATGYEVRKTNAGDPEPVWGYAEAGTSTSFAGLVPGQSYTFWVTNDCNYNWSGITVTIPFAASLAVNGNCTPVAVNVPGGGNAFYYFTASEENLYVVGDQCDDAGANFFDLQISVFDLDGNQVGATVDGAGLLGNEAGLFQGLTVGNQYYVSFGDWNGDFFNHPGTLVACFYKMSDPGCTFAPGWPTTFNYDVPHHTGSAGADNYSSSWDDGTNIYTAGPQVSPYFQLDTDLAIPAGTNGVFNVTYTAHFDMPVGGQVGIATNTAIIDVVQPTPCTAAVDIPTGAFNSHLKDYYSYADDGSCVVSNINDVEFLTNTALAIHATYLADYWRWEFTNIGDGLPAIEYDSPSSYWVMFNAGPTVNAVSAGYIAPGKCYEVRVKPMNSDNTDAQPYGEARVWKTVSLAGGEIGFIENIDDGSGLDDFIVARDITTIETEVAIYPNPNTGDFFNLNVSNVQSDVITLDIYDMFGRIVQSEVITVEDETVNQIVQLNGEIASGIYTVKMIVNGNTMNERLVIER